jgi:ATP-binding cassette subfamily C protein LapB
MIGQPDATSAELLRVLRLTGLDQIAARHPSGINLPVGENGDGLSGGQRQLVALARTLLLRPNVLLLDEPTSAMDNQTEALFLEHLKNATADQTMVVVTHRPSLLALVNRIVIIENGKVAADGPKDHILAALRGEVPKPATAAANQSAVAAVSANESTPSSSPASQEKVS